jgi:hypothetical protein
MSASFSQDLLTYARQIKRFQREDWCVYCVWVGLMFGLLASVSAFALIGYLHGVAFPDYVWNVPIGVFIFVAAISFDTIGHRTSYKEALKNGEDLVHHITIFAGVSSCVLLCLAYSHRDALMIPSFVMVSLSIFYSFIDEWMHWKRYLNGNSDRIEMWSHFFIFVGHFTFVISWSYWFYVGYPGVQETLRFLK